MKLFRSLTGKFIFLSLLIGLFITIYIYGSFVLTNHIRGEATRINLTGELRFRAFETAWLAHKIIEAQDLLKRESYKIELKHEIDTYNSIIRDLVKGNKELNIKPLEYEEPLDIIMDVTEEWNKSLKPVLLQISNSSREDIRIYIDIFDQKIHEHVYKIDRFAGLLEQDYIRELKEYDLFRLYAIGFFVVLSVFTVFFLRNEIVSPIRKLTEGVKEIGRGNFDIRLRPKGEDEIGILASSFNSTAEKLKNLLYSLKKSEESLKKAQHIAHLGSWEWDIKRNELTWSDEVFRIFGVDRSESLTYESFIGYVHPDDRDRVRKAVEDTLNRKRPYSIDHRIIRSDGLERIVHEEGEVTFDSSSRPISMSGTVQDITDYKRLEEQLIQAQKMEAIGQLAGGIAHDFNNILTAIIGYASIILEDLKEDDPVAVRVSHILSAAEKGANLVQNLLTFSRKQTSNPRPIDLNEIIKGIYNLLRKLIRENIELRVSLTQDEIVIMADSGQIEQVLMNLVTNARDAMPEGGVLSIKTERVSLDETFVKTYGFGQVGNYALLTVSDTGVGMDEKTKERIFEPFFTTKEVGKGTGLGMAMVYSIVRQHNGYIDIHSKPNKGTTFRIYLPLLSNLEQEKVEITHPEEIKGGTETILLSEDDSEVRDLISEILKGSGYKVIVTSDGEEAIKKFLEKKEEIDLVLLDLMMPGKSGKEVYEVIRDIKPDIKSLFMSGYSYDILKDALVKESRFIHKPISPTELLKELREILDRN